MQVYTFSQIHLAQACRMPLAENLRILEQTISKNTTIRKIAVKCYIETKIKGTGYGFRCQLFFQLFFLAKCGQEEQSFF